MCAPHVLSRPKPVLLGMVLVVALFSAAGLAVAQQRLAPLVQLTANSAHDVRPAWSPDGRHIAFQSNRTGQYQVWAIDPDGSNERRLSGGEADDRHPAWSPNGQWIAFDSGDDFIREIWIMDAQGQNRRSLTSLDAFASFPNWSPDGQEIAFYIYKDGVMDVWVTRVDRPSARPLTNGLADERRMECTFACHAPNWSPDGEMLAFSGGDHRTVFTLPMTNGDPIQVTSGQEHAHFPWFLPDGRLAYIEEHITSAEAWTEVWVMDLAGQQPPELLMDNIRLQGPYYFSPEGERLVFHSPRAGNFDIYLANLNVPGGREALAMARAPAELAPGIAAQQPASQPAVPAAGPPAAAAAPAVEPEPVGSDRALVIVGLGVGGALLSLAMLRYLRRRGRGA